MCPFTDIRRSLPSLIQTLVRAKFNYTKSNKVKGIQQPVDEGDDGCQLEGIYIFLCILYSSSFFIPSSQQLGKQIGS